MNIFSRLGQSIYDFLDKKVDKSKIETVSSSLSASLHFKELAFYIATSYIANVIGKCEFQVYEGGKRVKNQLDYTLNVNPNPNYSGNRFKNKLVYQYFYDQGALIIPKRDRIYIADSFDIDKSPGLGEWKFKGVQIDDFSDPAEYNAGKVFYLQQDDKDVKKLIDGMHNDYGALIASAMKKFKDSNGKKYKLAMDSQKAGDTEFMKTYEKVISEQLKSFLENSTAVYPQFQGYDLEEFGANSKYAAGSNSDDIIKLRKDAFEMVSQAIKIPMSLLQGNITNMQEIVKVFLTFCITPLANAISSELTRKTCNYEKWKNGYYVKVDTSKINHYDVLEMAEKVDKLMSSGTTNIDEVRELLGMALLNTEFSKTHFITKNWETAEEALKGDGLEMQAFKKALAMMLRGEVEQ